MLKYGCSAGVFLWWTVFVFFDQKERNSSFEKHSEECVRQSFCLGNKYFLYKSRFLPDLHVLQTNAAASNTFCSCPTETVSLSVQLLQNNVQSPNSQIHWCFDKAGKKTLTVEESAAHYFSFDLTLNLSSVLLCRWLSPGWRGELSGERGCTTAQLTWSRRSLKWPHPSLSSSRMLCCYSDAGWPTRTGSVSEALEEHWNRYQWQQMHRRGTSCTKLQTGTDTLIVLLHPWNQIPTFKVCRWGFIQQMSFQIHELLGLLGKCCVWSLLLLLKTTEKALFDNLWRMLGIFTLGLFQPSKTILASLKQIILRFSSGSPCSSLWGTFTLHSTF